MFAVTKEYIEHNIIADIDKKSVLVPSNKNILLSQPALSLNTNLKETNSLLEKIYDRIDSFNVEKIIHNNYSSISNVKNVNTYDRMVQPFVNAVTKFDKAVGELIENLKSETVIKTVSTSINNSNNEQNSYKNYKGIIVLVLPARSLSTTFDRNQYYKLIEFLSKRYHKDLIYHL